MRINHMHHSSDRSEWGTLTAKTTPPKHYLCFSCHTEGYLSRQRGRQLTAISHDAPAEAVKLSIQLSGDQWFPWFPPLPLHWTERLYYLCLLERYCSGFDKLSLVPGERWLTAHHIRTKRPSDTWQPNTPSFITCPQHSAAHRLVVIKVPWWVLYKHTESFWKVNKQCVYLYLPDKNIWIKICGDKIYNFCQINVTTFTKEC